MKFYKCENCGNIIAYANKFGTDIVCCGKPITELKPNSTDASCEKHVPCYTIENNILTVSVGSVEHPMTPEHYIEWIAITTNYGNQRKILLPDTKPCAKFALLDGEELNNIYTYCNLHELWSIK